MSYVILYAVINKVLKSVIPTKSTLTFENFILLYASYNCMFFIGRCYKLNTIINQIQVVKDGFIITFYCYFIHHVCILADSETGSVEKEDSVGGAEIVSAVAEVS